MYFPQGVELRDNIRFIHREMVWHHVVKIGSRRHLPFGRYDDSRAEHFYSYNVIKHRTFSRKLSHIYIYTQHRLFLWIRRDKISHLDVATVEIFVLYMSQYLQMHIYGKMFCHTENVTLYLFVH